MAGPVTSRRTAVAAGVAGVAGLTTALTACGTADEGAEEEGVEEGAELARTADVPVGAGVILEEERLVLTQPRAGEYRAFSAVCTHQGCVVSDIADGTINCACHGSRFALADGSVVRGPAELPLPARRVTVDGDVLRLG